VEKPTDKQTYEVGSIFGFKTSPFTRFSSPETNRFAALKVRGVSDRGVIYVVLGGIFDRMPTLEQLAAAKPLTCRRFFFRGSTALRCSPQEWDNDLLEFRHIATRPLSADDLALAATNKSYGSWSGASTDAEGEWRWAHDREAVESEVRQANAERDAKLAADRLRYENRLKRLSWNTLVAETPFERWNRHPPFPPPEFVNAARERVRKAVLDLRALGAKPRKTAVRAVLKSCVQWFNEQDRVFNGVIETEEREDICLVLLELAVVARHRSLAREVDNWREW
jgi:hypothetical protein